MGRMTMIALKIEDIKSFTLKLFVGEVFDSFLLKEASITTFNTFFIDGSICRGFYSREELEENPVGERSTWSMVKNFCFSLIKGKKLPGSFKIILQMPKEGVTKFLETRQISLSPEQVKGLLINIRYENERLMCVTGTSVSIFTLDKTLDEEWDQAFQGFLKNNQIPFQKE
ncbi:DUF5721 family protein [Clostridium sp. E02]|uniref:DUF5721 family protein n=1 Tax=Clostridium sp. E02 TaxID=2487134 RepID=UPI00325AE37F